MTVRELRAKMSQAGAVPLRINGSHEVWGLPGGGTIPIVGDHKGADASPGVVASVRRAFSRAGLDPKVLR